jgi:hypothetical protein
LKSLARCTGEGTFEGIHHHWDSYPNDGPGQFLIRVLTGHFQNDLAWMMGFLIDEHPAGRAIARRCCRPEPIFLTTVYMTVAGASRFQGMRPHIKAHIYKDQPSWPIYVSNCIYETYDLCGYLHRIAELIALQLIVVAFPPCALLYVVVLRVKP